MDDQLDWHPSQGCPNEGQLWALAKAVDEIAPRGSLSSGLDGECCYTQAGICGQGRPFLVAGEARVAQLAGKPRGTQPAFEAALASAWAQDALAEHASVAAFARLSLQLLAFGAPAHLVEASQRASLDELKHTRFCFERANRYAEEPLGPGCLDTSGALDDADFESLMFSNIVEGCIGETLAAVRVGEQARRTNEEGLAAALSAISEDEARHAELAYRILSWGFAVQHEATHRALSRALAASQWPTPEDSTSDPPDSDRWHRHGRLTRDERAELDHATWTQTLLPLLRTLQTPRNAPRPGVVSPAAAAPGGAASS
jgi:hypothetical protein